MLKKNKQKLGFGDLDFFEAPKINIPRFDVVWEEEKKRFKVGVKQDG